MVKEYKNLVFKGGGVKSYAYIGALEVLEQHGVLSGIEKVAGSSAGAVYAVLIGLNFSVSEIIYFMSDMDLGMEMIGVSSDEVLENFFYKYGQYDGTKTIGFFRETLSVKLGNPDVTFRDLHDNYPEMNFKEIYLTGVDISDGKLSIFSYENTPDMKLSDAVRISGSYPIMYTPVQLEDGHYYVDGGLLDNYPVSVFEGSCSEVDAVCESSSETLGLFLGGHDEVVFGLDEISSLMDNVANKFSCDESAEKFAQYLSEIDFSQVNTSPREPITNVASYMSRLFAVYSLVEYPEYGIDEISIDDRGLSALDLDLQQSDIDALISNGRTAAEEFIENMVL